MLANVHIIKRSRISTSNNLFICFFSQIPYIRNMDACVVVLTKSYLKDTVEQAVMDVNSSSIHNVEGETYTIGHNPK